MKMKAKKTIIFGVAMAMSGSVVMSLPATASAATLSSSAQPVHDTSTADPKISILPNDSVSPNFNFGGTEPDNYYDTPFSVTTSKTETITVNVVQWQNSGTAKVEYRLVSSSGKTTGWHTVSGNYTSSATFIYFTDMLKGTYHLQLKNIGTATVYGNGYIHYT